METGESKKTRASARKRATAIKAFPRKNLIVVLEDPMDIGNIEAVIRNANTFGVEKVNVVDPRKALPDDWQDMGEQRPLSNTSASAVKRTIVKRFACTEQCLDHLEKQGFVSIATSPHVKGKASIYLHEGDYTQQKLAVWFANETNGLSALAVERSEMCVAVQMFGMIESLNLGTSTSIVLYEVTKQRWQYQSLYSRSRQKGKRAEPLSTGMPREGDVSWERDRLQAIDIPVFV